MVVAREVENDKGKNEAIVVHESHAKHVELHGGGGFRE